MYVWTFVFQWQRLIFMELWEPRTPGIVQACNINVRLRSHFIFAAVASSWRSLRVRPALARSAPSSDHYLTAALLFSWDQGWSVCARLVLYTSDVDQGQKLPAVLSLLSKNFFLGKDSWAVHLVLFVRNINLSIKLAGLEDCWLISPSLICSCLQS